MSKVSEKIEELENGWKMEEVDGGRFMVYDENGCVWCIGRDREEALKMHKEVLKTNPKSYVGVYSEKIESRKKD